MSAEASTPALTPQSPASCGNTPTQRADTEPTLLLRQPCQQAQGKAYLGIPPAARSVEHSGLGRSQSRHKQEKQAEATRPGACLWLILTFSQEGSFSYFSSTEVNGYRGDGSSPAGVS